MGLHPRVRRGNEDEAERRELTVRIAEGSGNLDHEAHHRGQLATWLAALAES